jgi:hypothetical protein
MIKKLSIMEWLGIISMIFVIIIFLLCVCRPFNKVINERQVTVTVTDKTVKNNGSEGVYLIFAEDANGDIAVYEITDSLFKFRFDSSDVYAGIEVGKTYTFTIAGSRNKLLSWYPNIYKYEEVEE